MSFVHRLDPAHLAVPAARLDDESLPVAPPPGGGLELCPHCGVENGVTASVCWSCEAELPAAGAFKSDTEHGRAAHAYYPVLTQVVEANVALTAPAAVANRHTREIVAAAVVVLALLAAGAYIYFPTPRSVLGAPLSRDIEGEAGGTAGGRGSVAPTKADPTNPESMQSARREAAPSAVADALAAAARALAVKPGAPSDVAAGALAVPATNNPVDVAARRNATPSANTAALAHVQRGKARGTMQSANAAAAVPAPSRLEPAQQTSEQFGPCTANVAALGLCTAPPAKPKE
jgi:hypothetical protein